MFCDEFEYGNAESGTLIFVGNLIIKGNLAFISKQPLTKKAYMRERRLITGT